MNKKIILVMSLMLLVGLTVFVSAKMVETQVQIHKGWNLIFGFVEPDALSGKLGSSSIKAIYAFIPTNQQYVRVYPDPEDTKIRSIDDDYMRQTSFWVYSDSETGEALNGVMNAVEYEIEEAPVPLNQHQLYKGWNFLAYIPEMQDKSLDELKGDCSIEKAYLWKFDDESDARGWVDMPMNGKFVGNKMLMMGFVVKVSDNCKLGKSSGITPPSIPPEDSAYFTPSCVVGAPLLCNEGIIYTDSIVLNLSNNYKAGESLTIMAIELQYVEGGKAQHCGPTDLSSNTFSTKINAGASEIFRIPCTYGFLSTGEKVNSILSRGDKVSFVGEIKWSFDGSETGSRIASGKIEGTVI